MFLPRTLTTPLPRKIGVAKGWPAMVSTIRNQTAIAVAPMIPVITPSRRKLCGRSAIGSSDTCDSAPCGENTQPPGIFQASTKLLEHPDVAPFSPFEARLPDRFGIHVITFTG